MAGIMGLADDEEGDGILTDKEKQVVLDGVIADIKEGNMEIADWRQYRKNQENEKSLVLSFDLQEENMIVTQELFINENCIHTLQALGTVNN